MFFFELRLYDVDDGLDGLAVIVAAVIIVAVGIILVPNLVVIFIFILITSFPLLMFHL